MTCPGGCRRGGNGARAAPVAGAGSSRVRHVTGAEVSAGFIHSCLAKAAGVVADVVKLIKALITAAYVAG
jgi:hypothetical protein